MQLASGQLLKVAVTISYCRYLFLLVVWVMRAMRFKRRSTVWCESLLHSGKLYIDETLLWACQCVSSHCVNTSHQDGWVLAWSRWSVRSVLLSWMDGNTHTLQTHTRPYDSSWVSLVTGLSVIWRQTCPKRTWSDTWICQGSPSCNRTQNFRSANVSMMSLNSWSVTQITEMFQRDWNEALRVEEPRNRWMNLSITDWKLLDAHYVARLWRILYVQLWKFHAKNKQTKKTCL